MFEGCLMIIKDHINFWHRNPLTETYDCDTDTLRNPTMNSVYSERLRKMARDTAKEQSLTIFEGVYGATSGPTFETPAEVRGFCALGKHYNDCPFLIIDNRRMCLWNEYYS